MLTIVVAVLVVALLVAAIAVLRRRQKPALPVIKDGGPLPVVLVHGLFGFDRIGGFDYFRGIAKHLGSLGCHAHAVRLPAYASVPARARRLVELIEALPHDRVDVIAHSLGGLDARYALSHFGLGKRVRTLVTIGTPHHGSQIADLVLKSPIGWANKLLGVIGIPVGALEWLSTESLERFNREVPDAPGVRYACVVGGMHKPESVVPLPLIAAHAYLRKVGGVNDGLVCVSSQYWGEVLSEIEADHFAQIGWSMRSPFDALGLYAFIVSKLGHLPKPNEKTAVAG